MRARLMTATAAAMVAVLSVQFLLGMGVNLTVHVAHAHFGIGSMMAVMRGQPLLMVHMMIGMLTAALALVAAVTAATSARAGVTVPAVVGLVAVLVAGYGGIRFLLTGGNTASFTMAAGFVVAYAAYFVELIALARLGPALPSAASDASPGSGAYDGRGGERQRQAEGARRAVW